MIDTPGLLTVSLQSEMNLGSDLTVSSSNQGLESRHNGLVCDRSSAQLVATADVLPPLVYAYLRIMESFRRIKT